MNTLLGLFLVLHIAGIVLLGGTTLINFIISKQFWNSVYADRNKAAVINSTTMLFGRITGIGGAITILTGIGMVIIYHGVVAEALWFRIKMILVLMLILNASFFARPQNIKLGKLLSVEKTASDDFNAIKTKMNFYYATQFIMLLIIFVLSVFKFG